MAKLRLAVAESLSSQAWVSQLRAKGHEVHIMPTLDEFDALFGPKLYRFLPGMDQFLNDFLKTIRREKPA